MHSASVQRPSPEPRTANNMVECLPSDYRAGLNGGMRIAVVAPSCTLRREAAERVQAIVRARGDCELMIHPQCFLSEGHFAGSDEERLAALREVMADDSVDAVWFARGGYGSNRIAEAALIDLPPAARSKAYLG